MHLKPTSPCPISTLIFGLGGGGAPYTYPMQNYRRTAKFFAIPGLIQRYFPGLYLTYVPRWNNAPQAHIMVSNINFDIWIWEGGPYTYPIKNYIRTTKFFATWCLIQRYCPSL